MQKMASPLVVFVCIALLHGHSNAFRVESGTALTSEATGCGEGPGQGPCTAKDATLEDNAFPRPAVEDPVALLEESLSRTNLNEVLTTDEISRFDAAMNKSKASPINKFNDQLDSLLAEGSGVYYEFQTPFGEQVFHGSAEGRLGSTAQASTVFPLASASKLFTAFATMYTMELKPKEWYPDRHINTFSGWEEFRDFPVHSSKEKANLTIHHLLTHTSGLPFGMRMSKNDLKEQTLFYKPGTQFGYTLGHRVVGWLLRDYWKSQPEAAGAKIQTVQDTFKWLYFDKMGLSEDTRFSDTMTELFGYSGQAGDASIQSTGADLIKLAVVALRRGSLPDGTKLISEKNWNRWAVPNLLPGGKLSKELVAWEGAAGSWMNWNVGGTKEKIMKQSGDYGWNYFGATYQDSKEIGWCGFFSSCLRVTYEHSLAFVMMQQDVADLKKSKPFLLQYFGTMAKSLQCTDRHPSRFPTACKVLSFVGGCKKKPTIFCSKDGKSTDWVRGCPISTVRGKLWHADTELDEAHYTCYVPASSR